MLAVLVVAVAFGAVIIFGKTEQPQALPPAAANTTPPPPPPAPLPAPATDALTADFAALQERLGGEIGITVAPAGGNSPGVSFGPWTTGAAWSTSKVPVAIAAFRYDGLTEPSQAMTAAITHSDNAAAEAMWSGLGDPRTAADAVDAVLREYGDPTVVQSQRVRPGFTAFGQTQWALTDQAHFAAAALCDPRNAPVVGLMGQISGDQRWGLGVIDGSRFKGGWGPTEAGGYLVRQFGLMPTPTGTAAVAIAVQPGSGSFGDGTAAMTEIASWLASHAADVPSGSCAT
ncbi:hypothetical protein SAMN04489835_0304 [Mycolicibacterium rutilum]|uniref:Beta-lactamase enzyme family protein n=1 Tax=Mycolicibacterium rutilum TaxID=370526 RepID=A0A1H6IFE5_MYCRU|nr:hypothetical protein SAMN04489835_0304 [Mycolicibacterium rutilum]